MSLLFRSPFSHFILHNGQEGGHVDFPSVSVRYHQELVGVKSLRLHTLMEAIVDGGRNLLAEVESLKEEQLLAIEEEFVVY